MTTSLASCDLFGSSRPFLPPAWTTTDDRIRGGASQSYLTALSNNCVRFYGHLDTSTLGGAGFASQFSPSEAPYSGYGAQDKQDFWDLSPYDGIELELGQGDGKVYTFILKDEEQPEKREDGREKAVVNWEVEFSAAGKEEGNAEGEKKRIWIPWGDFKATYRGKKKDDAGELKTGGVRRVGLMMRSYFGKQEGDFTLEIKVIRAKKQPSDSEKETKERAATEQDTSSVQKPMLNGQDKNELDGELKAVGALAWLKNMCKLS